ncbi:MAG TPA: hypothetical protein V6D33_12970, partial [Cyanophyceae cyanobacterium]
MTKNPKLTRPNVENEINFNQNPELNPGALIDFASVAEQVGATTKRLTKASLLGSYFTSLSDNDLVLAARYFSGYIFPLRDQRTINIGGAALLSALAKLAEGIAAVSEQEKSAIQERLVKLGDLGDVTEEAFTNNPQRLGRKKVSDELLATVPVAFIAYDVLYAFGRVLINEPFAKRRNILESLHLDTIRVRGGLSQQVSDISGLDAEFTEARA